MLKPLPVPDRGVVHAVLLSCLDCSAGFGLEFARLLYPHLEATDVDLRFSDLRLLKRAEREAENMVLGIALAGAGISHMLMCELFFHFSLGLEIHPFLIFRERILIAAAVTSKEFYAQGM